MEQKDIFKLENFDLSKIATYTKPRTFLNNEGFSFRIKYPNKWTKTNLLNENKFTLIRFKVEDDLNKCENSLLNISIIVEFYQESIPGSFQLKKVSPRSLKTLFPIDIEIENLIRFDIFEQQFYIENDKIEFTKLIDFCMKNHLITLYKFNGFPARIKIYIEHLKLSITKPISKTIRFILKYLLGNEITNEEDPLYDEKENSLNIKEIKYNKKKDYSFGEYSTNFNTIISYCSLTLIFYGYIYFIKIENKFLSFIIKLTENNFFTIVLAILSLSIYDKLFRKTLIILHKALNLNEFSVNQNIKITKRNFV
ncbi:hypothetical protein ND861_19155 [Leptospira sp. 2 VSF19]|uniref:Uncharacterized protein n=1 Tax=Leptospira soteropolitanensis TaxID=2950025 RepID=A0AAW5VTZ1_9LEPT|nr:hypothetical protein [Leptospira soteropolitanensis]MCW7494789.1 hypothetical protein [Leptospira soteropolitanensis]MCW7502385.1 hypothetical protein [Leptospira soteropolitanensis]MCW7524616.1 hypothetical protein [Leptospira soteropolitanensis]MCW7528483.1 hypothetical protein [Leptospira soteropolitanensis]MCW7532352.1 hypothetical protein [Leptospira soteropolitanensis]